MRNDATFSNSDRLRKSPEFARIQKIGRRFHTKNFIVVVARESDHPASRVSRLQADGKAAKSRLPAANNLPKAVKLGITITNKLEPSSVRRNRVKRIVREAFRHIRQNCVAGISMLIIAKSGSTELVAPEVKRQLSEVLKMNGFLK